MDAIPALAITPNVDFASERWTVDTAGATYYTTGDYVLLNSTADLDITDQVSIGIGGRNLTDES